MNFLIVVFFMWRVFSRIKPMIRWRVSCLNAKYSTVLAAKFIYLALCFYRLKEKTMAFKNTTYFTSFNAKGCDIKEGLITIPNKVEKCTKELLVYYTCDSVQKMGCADKNMLIGACSIIECQSTIRSIIDNEYINVKAVDDVVLVDIKPFNWQRVLNFLNEFVNDANDFVYISVLLALILILIFFSKDVISK